MKGINYRIEKQLVLKHDVILGSRYEIENVLIKPQVPLSVQGGESMAYESSQVISLGRPDKNGVITRKAIKEAIEKTDAFPIKINGHTIGQETKASGNKTGGKSKPIGKNKA